MGRGDNMKLVQTRVCDASCCKAKPRFPNVSGDCMFLVDNICRVTCNTDLPVSPALPDMTGREAFNFSCKGWPHNTVDGRDTGKCCWEWQDGD